MNLSLLCPFAAMQDHGFELQGLKNYISHLKKCQQIALFVKQTKNEFHICPYCVQVYVNLQEAQIHRDTCKQTRMCQIKDDAKWVIKLGIEGSSELDQLQELISIGSVKQIDRSKQYPAPTNYNSKLPYQKKNQILPQQKKQKRQQMEEDCVMLGDDGQNILQFKVQERDSILKPLRLSYFNGYLQQQVDIRYFENKVTVDMILNLLTSQFKVNTALNFLKYKVLEFIDDIEGDIEEELEDKVYYSVKKADGHTILWILANEQCKFFQSYISEYPWGLFKVSTNHQSEGTQPVQIIKTNEMLILQQKREQFKALKMKDEMLNSQIIYENIMTAQVQKLIQDQTQKNSRLQVKMIMNESMTKNLSQLMKTRYDEELIIMQQKLQTYLEGKKKEQKEEFDQKTSSNQELLAKYQPILEKLQQEEEQLKDFENELLRRYQTLNEDSRLLAQDQKQTRKVPTQIQKRPVGKLNQELCIECKVNKRNTLIKPCQHCLFCEQCFIKLSVKGVQCPLKNSKRCIRTNFLKKCIVLKFVKN